MEHPFFQKRSSQALFGRELTLTLTHGSTLYNLKPSFKLQSHTVIGPNCRPHELKEKLNEM